MALTLALAAAACGDVPAAETSQTAPDVLALADEATTSTAADDDTAGQQTAGEEPLGPVIDDGPAPNPTTTITLPGRSGETNSSSTAAETTSGQGSGSDTGSAGTAPPNTAPATTSAPPVGATQAPEPTTGGAISGYRGVLGGYDRDQVLATSPVAMPSVSSGTMPLTGLPGSSSGRRAVVVKIDNSAKARPQTGLELADVIIEQEVEGGLTRFAAIFQTNEVRTLGPVRSARSTDLSFLSSLGTPALAYSGANDVFDQLIRELAAIDDFSAARNGNYWRDRSRSAPSNMYTNTTAFSAGGTPPPAWFHFGTPTGGTPVANATVAYPRTSVVWEWDGGGWLRSQDGRRHMSTNGSQLRATNVVVAAVPVVDSGLVDPAGSVVPEFVWAGSGPVTVFSNGQRFDGTWTRPTLRDPAVLVDASGSIIPLVPGTTWVELVSG